MSSNLAAVWLGLEYQSIKEWSFSPEIAPIFPLFPIQRLVWRYEHILENSRMKTKNVTKSPTSFTPVRFVNLNMNEEMKTAFKSWDARDDLVGERLGVIISDGYRFSITFDSKHNAYTANFMMHEEGAKNQGMCLSARAGDWFTAIRLLIWKHDVFCQGEWPSAPLPLSGDLL